MRRLQNRGWPHTLRTLKSDSASLNAFGIYGGTRDNVVSVPGFPGSITEPTVNSIQCLNNFKGKDRQVRHDVITTPRATLITKMS